MPRVKIHMKISQKMKSTQGITVYLKNPPGYKRQRIKKTFSGLHQPEDKKK
jgi:hypothetical protein